MKKIVVLFNKPVKLPGEEMEQIISYGLCLNKSGYTSVQNIRSYISSYILVIAQIYKDKTIEFLGNETFKKEGKIFSLDGDVWEKYYNKAQKTKLQFAIVEVDDTEVPNEDTYDILLTAKEKWKQLKGREDIVWNWMSE